MLRPKLIALALAGLLTLAAFVGCAGEDNPAATLAPDPTPRIESGALDPESPQGQLRAYDYFDFGEAPTDRVYDGFDGIYRTCPKVRADASGQRILDASIVGAAWRELLAATEAFDELAPLPPLPWEEGEWVYDETIDAYYRDIPDNVALAWVELYRPWYDAIENAMQAIDKFLDSDECGA